MARLLYFTRDYNTHDHRFLSALVASRQQVFDLRLESRAKPLESRPTPEGVTQVKWAGGTGPARLQDGPRLLVDLRRVLRKIQPDLVLAGPLQRSALLAALSGFQPLVSMSWGYDLIFDARRGPLWRWATRFVLQRSRLLLGDSAVLRNMAKGYGMPDEHILTFPWGVDLEHYTPGKTEPGSRPDLTLLSTRGWEPIYGIDVLARGFVDAAQKLPNLRLLMLGQGSLAGDLRRIFQQGGVIERVHMPGLINQAELPRYYHLADLYISASHSDGSSISLLEAMACGRPALVSGIPGNKEWVCEGENGWLFQDGSPEALSRAIQQAAAQQTTLAKMGKNARQVAEQRADWHKNFPQLLEACERLLVPA